MKPALIINGAAGRMGKRIVALAFESKQFDIVGAADYAEHPDLGKDIGPLAGIEAINVDLSAVFPDSADVMVDFSLPQAADKAIDYCVKNNVALVMGTTGLSDGQSAKLKNASARIAIMQATNMSLGMNLLFATVGKVAKALGENYDIEIVEAHHRFKLPRQFGPRPRGERNRTPVRNHRNACHPWRRHRGQTQRHLQHARRDGDDFPQRAHPRHLCQRRPLRRRMDYRPKTGFVRHAGCSGAEVKNVTLKLKKASP
ncbi:MAG: 4-hydroxy-tetrahydrodipicolinate reductase [Planctomycetota bacterium]|jgi:4-hydroxy-tetrahydrodipicolinate reductase